MRVLSSTILIVLSFFIRSSTATADGPPLGYDRGTVAVRNATVHAGPGVSLESACVIMTDGRITAVGEDVMIPPGATVIDAEGLHVYAGLIDAANTRLLEKGEMPEQRPGREPRIDGDAWAAMSRDHRHGLTPEWTVDDLWPAKPPGSKEWRKFGFTVAHVVPTGRIASGQTAMVSLSDRPYREAVIATETAAALRLFAQGGSTYPATLMGAHAHLRQALLDAALHAAEVEQAADRRRPHDPALDALQRLSDGDIAPLFYVEDQDDLERALRFASDHEWSPLFWGASKLDEWNRDPQLAERFVILGCDFGKEPEPKADAFEALAVKRRKHPAAEQDELDRWNTRVGTAARLAEVGTAIAFSTDGFDEPDKFWKALRQAVKAGLTHDQLLAALTTNPAERLGVDDRLGRVAVGMYDHVIVTSAPLDDPDCRISYVFADGRMDKFGDPPKNGDDQPGDDLPEVAGDWRITFTSAEPPRTGRLALRQDNAKLTGTYAGDDGDGRIENGEVSKEGELKFDVLIAVGDTGVRLRFEGKFEGGSLAGTVSTPFAAPGKWTGVAADASPVSPPASPAESSPEVADADAAVRLTTIDTDDDNAESDKGADTKSWPWPVERLQDRIVSPSETDDLLIRNATVLTGTGETLRKTSILIRNGKIAKVGPKIRLPAGVRKIDADGRYVMPGIIDTHSHIMIAHGINEATDSIVAEVRVKDVVRTDDVSEYRALAGGVTTARLLHGSANVIGGQDAVVKLKHGRSMAEHILDDAPQGIKFALGENVKRRGDRFPNTRMGVEATLQRAFLEAVDYRRRRQAAEDDDSPLSFRRDLRLEALAGIVDHEIFIHCHSYRADEILMLLRVAEQMGIRVWSLQHVLEGYKVAPEIAAHKASCSTFADWWAYKVEAFDATPFNPFLLQQAGANVVIKSDDWELIRHLYQEAAKPLRYGELESGSAIQFITKNPAWELGLSDRIGTIEVDKDGDLAIFSGHPLNAFSRCEMTIIEGQVYFDRSQQPSAMSAEGAERGAESAQPTPPILQDDRPEFVWPEDIGDEYAVVGATVHPVDGDTIEDGVVWVRDGRIHKVTNGKLPKRVTRIDAAGLHVYPGLIDAGTTLGLQEVSRVSETHDHSEGGLFQPDVRAGVAINPDSELLPVAMAGGITTFLMHPNGGRISGQCSIARPAGWTVNDMVTEMEAALRVNWPSGEHDEEAIEELGEQFRAATRYAEGKAADAEKWVDDPRMEALVPYAKGDKPVFIEAEARHHIAQAIRFADDLKLKVVITGGTDAWKLAEELKSREIPVIVGPVMRSPLDDADPFDAPYANAGRLHEAGVSIAIRSDNPTNSRNAPFEAAMAVAYGLPAEQALRSVTIDAAKILGIAEETGSLTKGKQADFLITDGSPLQPATRIKAVAVDGKLYPPASKQSRLYEKYRERLSEARAD